MLTIKKGDRGPNVVQLQYLLTNRGFSNIKIDGDFGPNTEAAVKNFQAKNNMPADGIVSASVMLALQGPTEATVKGIDISHYQPKINWQKVKGAGISFAYIKTTEGVTVKDTFAASHATSAKLVGIKIGYYHFASLNDTNVAADATAEAKFFDSVMKVLPIADLPPVLDIEVNKSNLSPKAVQLWISTFLDVMVQLGYPKTILYSYTPFLDQNLPLDHPFGNNPLWIAQYKNVNYPKMPHGWDKYTVWQYSSTDPVDGIGPCDNNKAPVSFIS